MNGNSRSSCKLRVGVRVILALTKASRHVAFDGEVVSRWRTGSSSAESSSTTQARAH